MWVKTSSQRLFTRACNAYQARQWEEHGAAQHSTETLGEIINRSICGRIGLNGQTPVVNVIRRFVTMPTRLSFKLSSLLRYIKLYLLQVIYVSRHMLFIKLKRRPGILTPIWPLTLISVAVKHQIAFTASRKCWSRITNFEYVTIM